METFDSSEHLAFVGSLCGHRLKLFRYSHQMDALWESYAVYKIQPGGKPFAIGQHARYLPTIVHLLIDKLQLSGVMSGVVYLHRLSIVHGDLKGVNSMFLIAFLHH